MNEIQRDENEPRNTTSFGIYCNKRNRSCSHDSHQQRKWVAESRIAQEIDAILVQHPEYYEEFRGFIGGLFPEPIR
jgi:hypothetical protein